MAVFTEHGDSNALVTVAGTDGDKLGTITDNDAVTLQDQISFLTITFSAESGTLVLSEVRSRYPIHILTGSLSGAMEVQPDADLNRGYWVMDQTTGGFDVDYNPETTGVGPITLPKNEWVFIRPTSTTNSFGLDLGWNSQNEPASFTFGTDWQNVSGRELELRKEASQVNLTGGFVHIIGAVEKTSAPANGDVMFTIPVNFRPAFVMGFAVPTDTGTNGSTAIAIIEIQTNGDVTLRSGAPGTNVDVDVSSIKFHSAII